MYPVSHYPGSLHGMGYMPNINMNFMPNMHGFGPIEQACHEKFPLAWGQPFIKSGELPPATPDPSQMFREGGFQMKQMRNPIPPEKLFNYTMNSPMFIPILQETSPRPTTSRQHFQGGNQGTGLNFTLNVNVNSDYRP